MTTRGGTTESREKGRVLGGLTVAVVLVLSLALLSGMAVLKETQLFWRNAGGWPVWLRDWVRVSYYPLMIAEALALTGLSGWALRRPGGRPRRVSVGVAAALWVWLGGVFLFTAANNVVNVLEGRPVHWHPALEVR